MLLRLAGAALLLAGLGLASASVQRINEERQRQQRAAPLLRRALRALPPEPFGRRTGVILGPVELERWGGYLSALGGGLRVVRAADPLEVSERAEALFRDEGVRRFVLGSGLMLAGALPAVRRQRDASEWACATWFSRRAYFKGAGAVRRAHPGWEVAGPCVAALLAPAGTRRLYGGESPRVPEPEGSWPDASSVLVVAEDDIDWRDLARNLRERPQLPKVTVMLVRPHHRNDRLMERLARMAERHAVTDVVCALAEPRMRAYVELFPDGDGALARARHLFAETVLAVEAPRAFMLGQRCLRFAAPLDAPERQGTPWGHAPYAGALRLCLTGESAPAAFDVLELQEVLGREVWRPAQRVTALSSEERTFVGDAPPERLVRCRVEAHPRQGLRVADLGAKVERYINNTCRKDSRVSVRAVDPHGHRTDWEGTVAELVTDVRMHVGDSTRIRFEACRGGVQVALMGVRPGQPGTAILGAESECMAREDPGGCMWRQPVGLEV